MSSAFADKTAPGSGAFGGGSGSGSGTSASGGSDGATVFASAGTTQVNLPTWTWLDPADGSVARIDDMPEGPPVVTRVGPRDLWQPIEAAHQLWQRLNRPRREWFTGSPSRMPRPSGHCP